MKAIWNLITVMALANLIAIVGFVWWLHFSGRLDMDRVEAARAMFSETIAEEARRARELEAEAEQEAIRAADVARMQGPPVTADELLSLKVETSEIDQQRLLRLKQDVELLTATLARERRVFDDEREAYLEEKRAFEEMRERLAAIEGDAQFAKSVAVLDSVKPAEAKQLINELLGEDSEQAVSYLNAMKPRQRTKVIAEFNKDGETDVAAGLLESLRTLGLGADEE